MEFCTLTTFRRNWTEIEFPAGVGPFQNLKSRWRKRTRWQWMKGINRAEIPRLLNKKKILNFFKIWIWRLSASNGKLLPGVKRRNGFFFFPGCALSTPFFLIRTIRPIPDRPDGIFWLNQRRKAVFVCHSWQWRILAQSTSCAAVDAKRGFQISLLLSAVIYLKIGLVDMSKSRWGHT